MRFRMLGRVEVETGGGVAEISSAPVRGVLAALMLAEGRVVPVQQLVEALWDRPPRSAQNNLRLHLTRLRRQLGAISPRLQDRLVTVRTDGGAGYCLRAEPDELDLAVFRGLAVQGDAERTSGRYAAADRTLSTALELWRGPVGQDCTASDRFRRRVAPLDELRLTVCERRAEVGLMLGRTTEVVPDLNDVLRVAPFRERAHANLVRARYLAGDVSGALRTWARAARVLREELGLEPSDELFDLQRAMLRRDREAVFPSCGQHGDQTSTIHRFGRFSA